MKERLGRGLKAQELVQNRYSLDANGRKWVDLYSELSEAPDESYRSLNLFRLPHGFRGRPAWFVLLWWIVQSTVFAFRRQSYGHGGFTLRLFGARIGKSVHVRPSARITYPWKVSIGDRAWVGDDAVLYSLGEIIVGEDSVVSQKCYLYAPATITRSPASTYLPRRLS